tara:strand:- start:361 stop:792 length:432 start_codon:yes stop_codon:yes gene_type:complete
MHRFSLTGLFTALHAAVSEATKVARDNGITQVQEDFFYRETEDAPYSPRTIALRLPTVIDGKPAEAIANVPLYALAHHQSLAIDQLVVSLDVELHALDEKEIMVASSAASTTTKVHIEMTFKGSDPPEGTMKINDKLAKAIPS